MILIVMGVAGCGKSTVGRALAARLGWPFYDGDDFHPPANVAKMSRGIPLTDADRAGWLDALADVARRALEADQSAVLACSALKQRYRDQLRVDPARVRFIYLKGSYADLHARLLTRTDHFMKPGMLESQFAALEEPADALLVDIRLPVEQAVEQIVRNLARRQGAGEARSAK
jgi:gluconokinase